MIKLTSIPPANRRGATRLDRLSSMRAATAFIGGHVGSISRQQPAGDRFAPHIKAPDPKVAEVRRELCTAMAGLAERLSDLLQSAEDVDERAYWQAAIDRLGSHHE